MRASAFEATEPKRATERIALKKILVCMTDSLLWLFGLSTYRALENPPLLESQVKWTGPRGSTGRHRRTRKLPPRRSHGVTPARHHSPATGAGTASPALATGAGTASPAGAGRDPFLP